MIRTMPLPRELTTAFQREQLNGELARLTSGPRYLTVSAFLDATSKLGDAQLDTALEGIWCGTEGRIREPYDSQHFVIIGWYANHVEYAYVS